MIPLYVGFDPREKAAFYAFSESVIKNATYPICLIPLALPLLRDYRETHTDGSNAFISSRFLVPHMQGYQGWALFCDGDMLCRDDIHKLWEMRDEKYAAMVVKHEYKTKHPRKYLGTGLETHNRDYPRKNWSSVILWNCGHPANQVLTPDYVMASTGSKLHRFEHLKDEEIGELPKDWNWLAEEYAPNPNAKLVHYTLGVPAMQQYAHAEHAREWFEAYYGTQHIET